MVRIKQAAAPAAPNLVPTQKLIGNDCSSAKKPKIASRAVVAQPKLETYQAPLWATSKIAKAYIPTVRLNLSTKNTPIQQWHLPGVPSEFELFIKRDDLNGSVLGGNKIRKLEFSIAKAIDEGYDHIVTWGSIASNHCRTTALVCAQFGIKCTLLQTTDDSPSDVVTKGNVLLSMLTNARCLLCPKDTPFEEARNMLRGIIDKIKADEGGKAYLVDRGGTQADSIFSYIDAFNEMQEQEPKLMTGITDIFVTTGSGGTAVGLGLGARLANSGIKVHGHRCWGVNADYYGIQAEELEAIGLDPLKYQDIVASHDTHVCGGYGKTCPEINDVVIKSPAFTGVPLCTTYTGKTVAAMLEMMHSEPGQFAGRKVLFVHTGGVPGLWGDAALTGLLKSKAETGKQFVDARDYLEIK